jgi:serine/threonine protein kinase/WD40 repeat protein
MGEVWRAYDLKLRVDVALKTLRAELLEKERALQALRQEVRIAREVVSPNVCRVFDLVELDGQELVSMEYIDGTTLIKILQSRGPLDLQEAREIASQFLAGLEAIHQAGLVHRDLKPENIMITRSGRVVVMDFGIAKVLADRKTGTVSGTPAYMAPEQARGEEVDARADVFSAGVVLAEMIAPSGIQTHTQREAIWKGIHHEPPEIPDSPWASVLNKSVTRVADQRYPSAAALARALEEVTLQVEGAEDVRPYPGLASFTEEDAEYFFGRELEVEAMWKKLRRPHLLGLIGPSGAGKSSFLRAGLLPVMPEGWRAVVTTPGSRPFTNLASVLVHELSSDTRVTEQFIHFEELEVAISLFRSWRKQHDHGLVIVDQFEELFTLNPSDVQERFAELLGRLAIDADVRVLLSMRDDFLYRCHTYAPLHPMLSELTLLGPPSGAALRRAVVQPALKCGYRFEEESLVEEILSEVEDERGALPMLAFAASQLWDHRDKEKGLLTKEAYEHIGGVGGALAQHAEATLEKIGKDRAPIVREVFRNLVTAQGTRAARDMEELLSVFEDKDAANEVLQELIDARLLTSFETTATEDEATSTRVEIIHESLLHAWPRLVRWQTQDQEGAQLRDELRQAAQMWEQHGRSADRLWTGTAFREYQLWRERYTGGLTTAEEAFADAMVQHANRRRRRKRLAVASIIIVLLGGMSLLATLWQGAERAREEAVQEAQRREAAQLLALAHLQIDEFPTGALAYTVASLERADSSEARRYAVEVLWRGPPAFILVDQDNNTLDFSPDGQWLAVGGMTKGVQLWSREGGPPRSLVASEGFPPRLAFGPDSETLFVASQLTGNSGKSILPVSVPEGKPGRRMDFNATTFFYRQARSLITFTRIGETSQLVKTWPLPLGEAKAIGHLDHKGMGDWGAIAGERIAYTRNRKLFLGSVEDCNSGRARLVGEHESRILWMTNVQHGQWIAAGDEGGEIRFWSLEGNSKNPFRRFQGLERAGRISLDPTGRWMASGYRGSLPTSVTSWLWDLRGPPDADPLPLRISETSYQAHTRFHPNGQWLAIGHGGVNLGPTLWPLNGKYSRVLSGHSGFTTVAFQPDGQSIGSVSVDGTVRTWPLYAKSGARSRVLLSDKNRRFQSTVYSDAGGRNALVAARLRGEVFLVPLGGSAPRLVKTFKGLVNATTLSDDGRMAAAAAVGMQSAEIHIWNLETGQAQVLDSVSDTADPSRPLIERGGVWYLRFMPDGRLFSAGGSGFRLWDLSTGTSELLQDVEVSHAGASTSPDGRYAACIDIAEDHTRSDLYVYDMVERRSWSLLEHGNRVTWGWASTFDPTGTMVVTGDGDGVVRVGPITGETPHLLFGHSKQIVSVAVSPDGRWIASSDIGGEIRLWPMPEGPPFHTLPHDELLDRLRSLTNLRVIPDEEAPSGYRFDYAPFPGWEKVPEW